MNNTNNEITLLSSDQIFGNHKLKIFKRYGTKSCITDFAILLGAYVSFDNFINNEIDVKKRTGWWWTKTQFGIDARIVNYNGQRHWRDIHKRNGGYRPALPYLSIHKKCKNIFFNINKIKEVEYGEYPQTVVNERDSINLEEKYNNGLLKITGKTFTTDSVKDKNYITSFKPRTHNEYEYEGKKYIRFMCTDSYNIRKPLSDSRIIEPNKPYWIHVEPIIWIVDEKENIALSKKILFSGVQFLNNPKYKGDFENTDIKRFLSQYFINDIIPSDVCKIIENNDNNEESLKQTQNFDIINEEDILKNKIENDNAILLYGPSSEGKYSRIKQIDWNCEIVCLRNQKINNFIGIKNEKIELQPIWYIKLKEKCERDKNKIHILFIDQYNNSDTALQEEVRKIILNRKINEKWVLPSNVRIVVGGNYKDNFLINNSIIEKTFNRSSRIFIKTNITSWIKWAIKNNIHPVIYSYIAYERGETLHNNNNIINPKKWEIASKILYQTNNLQLLRALIGEDLTQKFIKFCNHIILTPDDIKNQKYKNIDISSLNKNDKYIITMKLSQIDGTNNNEIKKFLERLGEDYKVLFEEICKQKSKNLFDNKVTRKNLVKKSIFEEKYELLLIYIKANIIPIIINNAYTKTLTNKIIIPANVDSNDLCGHFERNQFVPPFWIKSITETNDNTILVIEKLDSIKKEEQLKFIELLKYRKVSTFELPDNCVIIITTNEININKINNEILSLVAII